MIRSRKLLSVLAISLMLSACSKPAITPPTDNTQPAAESQTAATQPIIISQAQLYQVVLDGSEIGAVSGTTIGCNDTLVALPVQTSLPDNALYPQLRNLFTTFDASQSGYTNPRQGQAAVSFQSFQITDNKLTLILSGALQLGGACELPRLEETIKATYKQFGFDEVQIIINGKEIHEYGNMQ